MRNLAHGRSAVGMHPPSEFSKMGYDLIIAGIQVAIGGWGIRRHQCATTKHSQADAALGLFFVVELVTLFWQTVVRVGRFMTGGHDTVLQCQVLQLEWLQQGIVARWHKVSLVSAEALHSEKSFRMSAINVNNRCSSITPYGCA